MTAVIGIGGKEDWTWNYTDCLSDENARFNDSEARKSWLEKRAAARESLEAKTKIWMASDDSTAEIERTNAVLEYRITTLTADPYLRRRTVYHRHKNLCEDGTVEWDYKSDAGDQKFGTSLDDMKRMLA